MEGEPIYSNKINDIHNAKCIVSDSSAAIDPIRLCNAVVSDNAIASIQARGKGAPGGRGVCILTLLQN